MYKKRISNLIFKPLVSHEESPRNSYLALQ